MHIEELIAPAGALLLSFSFTMTVLQLRRMGRSARDLRWRVDRLERFPQHVHTVDLTRSDFAVTPSGAVIGRCSLALCQEPFYIEPSAVVGGFLRSLEEEGTRER